jgi:outer membrane protein assembly factor BamB
VGGVREKLKSRKFKIIFISAFIILTLILSFVYIQKKITTTEPEEPPLSKLYTLPYISGRYKPPTKDSITRFNPKKSYLGLNLYNSAHAPSAFLMDMNGHHLHRWRFAFKEAFPDVEEIHAWYNQKHWRHFWRRVHLFNNGDLLAIYEGNGIIRIDKDSHLIWAKAGGFHHDLEVVGDKIYTLNRRLVTLPRINEKNPILEDLITILDENGRMIKNISILELFERSEFAHLMEGMPPAGDIFHTNTIEIMDGKSARKSPLFKKGNVLLSMRMLDTIAVADLEEEKIIWAKKPGIWKTQHQPTMLDNGNMMVFNNLYIKKREDKAEFDRLTNTNGYKLVNQKIYEDDMSSIMEFDPLTMEIKWEYRGEEKNSFFSLASGSNQRLANGNTLITESDRGRAFEVEPEGEIVWEYINIHRTGKNKEKIAAILEMIRLRPQPNFFLKTGT